MYRNGCKAVAIYVRFSTFAGMLPEQEFSELIAHKLRFVAEKTPLAVVHSMQNLAQPAPSYLYEQLSHFGVQLLSPAECFAPQAAVVLVFIAELDVPQGVALLPQLAALPGLDRTLAVQNNRVYLLSEPWFSQADGLAQLECLAEVLYPRFFAFGHQGVAWIPLSV